LKSRYLIAFAAPLLGTGCAVLTATPPQVEVQQVAVRGIGLLDQVLAVGLCMTNFNDTELGFRQVMITIDVSGTPVAEGFSETPVRLPPRASILVPFEVVTSTRNLASQLLGIANAGAVDYRLHGSVQLLGKLAVNLPFSHSGRLELLAIGLALVDIAAAPSGTRCTPVMV